MNAQDRPLPVHGIYLRHSTRFGFRYRYTCELCKRDFIANVPELNAPALCHQCYTGGNSWRG